MKCKEKFLLWPQILLKSDNSLCVPKNAHGRMIKMKIYRSKSMKKTMIAVLCGSLSQQAAAINIEFDYSFDSNNFFNTQARKDVLSAAGSFFTDIIQDDLTAINSGGVNNFDAIFSNPGSGASETISGFSVAADTLTVFAGGRSLTGSTLGVGGPGGFSVSGTGSFVNNAVSRGETGDTLGATATDFSPWGGAISFNTTSSWYFDPDVSTDGDVINNDFYSVALHEIGHLLGLGTAHSWDNLVSGTDFTGTASVGVFGGDVPLAGGLAHWLDGTTSLLDGVLQEAAMDPSILTGTRKEFTDLDVAALSDVGWEVVAVPVPAAVWLFGTGLLGLVAVARKHS